MGDRIGSEQAPRKRLDHQGNFVRPKEHVLRMKGRRISLQAADKIQAIAAASTKPWWPATLNKADPINAQRKWTFVVDESWWAGR